MEDKLLNTEEEFELDWEAEIDDGSEFERVLFEPGDYDFKVVNVEKSKTKETGNNMAVVDIEVTDGKRKAEVRDWIVLTNKTIWKIASFFRSIGLKKHGEKVRMRWNEAVGLTGRCTVEQEERTSNKGNTYMVNRINAYLDPEDEVEEIEW